MDINLKSIKFPKIVNQKIINFAIIIIKITLFSLKNLKQLFLIDILQ